MDVFPAFYPLAGRRVGLAGEGEGLEARRRLLRGSPAELVILDAGAAVSADAWAGMALGFIAQTTVFDYSIEPRTNHWIVTAVAGVACGIVAKWKR